MPMLVKLHNSHPENPENPENPDSDIEFLFLKIGHRRFFVIIHTTMNLSLYSI